MIDQNLYNLVSEAYENAAENGYLDDMTPYEVAVDMLDCDGDIEGADFDEVLECIETYLNSKVEE